MELSLRCHVEADRGVKTHTKIQCSRSFVVVFRFPNETYPLSLPSPICFPQMLQQLMRWTTVNPSTANWIVPCGWLNWISVFETVCSLNFQWFMAQNSLTNKCNWVELNNEPMFLKEYIFNIHSFQIYKLPIVTS